MTPDHHHITRSNFMQDSWTQRQTAQWSPKQSGWNFAPKPDELTHEGAEGYHSQQALQEDSEAVHQISVSAAPAGSGVGGQRRLWCGSFRGSVHQVSGCISLLGSGQKHRADSSVRHVYELQRDILKKSLKQRSGLPERQRGKCVCVMSVNVFSILHFLPGTSSKADILLHNPYLIITIIIFL